MRKLFAIIALATATAAAAETAVNNSQQRTSFADSIIASYTDSLAIIVDAYTNPQPHRVVFSPYLFRLLSQGTLYNAALTQQMAQQQTLTMPSSLPSLGSKADYQLLLVEASNNQLARAYTAAPQLFTATQQQLTESGGLRTDITAPIVEEVKLAQKVEEETPDVEVEAVEPEVKKPNFWTFKGNGGLQFTQNYVSKNWYKGGLNSYTMLSILNVEANYNNQRKVSLSNKFEARLGFQTAENNVPKFRPTDNLLRFTSNLAIKAIGHWNYAAQLQLQSQPYRGYQGASKTVISDFLSPLYVRSSIGMDYNIKKKRFDGVLKLAPLSYVITYVHVDSRVTRYGIHEGHNSKHDWGPNLQFTFNYKMTKDISWQSRLYWFSNFKSTLIENEHTFKFTINKYLSANLFLYPRFDDTRFWGLDFKKDADGKVTDQLSDDSARRTHWMFQEYLSIGLNYDF
ncbi:MAG: DUF3078 domain-containing protein [Bacteroidaceae bacterium]|nr:DUF3078 domain-containing protein [Bacteroidaceae bacterium]